MSPHRASGELALRPEAHPPQAEPPVSRPERLLLVRMARDLGYLSGFTLLSPRGLRALSSLRAAGYAVRLSAGHGLTAEGWVAYRALEVQS